ncbi:hypothetical protein Z517_09362 [Fonsecaea pedrosoi CBS 271.37]|uniref:Unplaced genomic scaffold supercont1.6, whole genome shotgun sequence n=1 Tax=Fonsecaea pedrosoi CBS 271.37 TaxID=1442368 RepID=A0A0D2G8B2_9EURO|nr:uncharacterized protein Z517_09362 [Fonsecaea pedrosoi CBS 271.37]KIW76918.1 hypothetical protein Z517_09362 [Fonsecaea pedrosoi CBS 271.37]
MLWCTRNTPGTGVGGGDNAERQEFHSRIDPDVVLPPIEHDDNSRIKQDRGYPIRPPRVKRDAGDDFEGEDWLDADDDVLRARLRNAFRVTAVSTSPRTLQALQAVFLVATACQYSFPHRRLQSSLSLLQAPQLCTQSWSGHFEI